MDFGKLCPKFNVYLFIWETFEILYRLTGLRWQTPIEFFYPNLGPWLFGKMTGLKGEPLVPKGDHD